MNKIIYVCIVFFAFISRANIPQEFVKHIKKEKDTICNIKNIGIDDKQQEMLLERYVDAMALKYEKNNQTDYVTREVINEIKTVIAQTQCPKELEETNSKLDIKFLAFLNDRGLEMNENKIVNFSYKDALIPFKVVRTYFDENTLELVGIRKEKSFKDKLKSCLILKIINRETIEISWLGSADSVCPIPKEKRIGTFLLKMAQELAQKLNMKFIQLQDESAVVCNKCGKKAWLADLSIFKYGTTWYGSYGYYSDEGKKSDLKSYKAMREFSIFSVLYLLNDMENEGLEKLKKAQKQRNEELDHAEIEKYYNKFVSRKALLETAIKHYETEKSIDEEEDIALGDFFAWLWEKDCERYIKIMKLVFPSESNIVLDEKFQSITKLRKSKLFYYKYLY